MNTPRCSRTCEAEKLTEEAGSIERKALGSEHPQLAVSLNNLACLLRDNGKTEEARQLGRKADRVLGPDDPQAKYLEYVLIKK